jgi:DNA processing protein
MNQTRSLTLLHLSLIDGIGPVTAGHVIAWADKNEAWDTLKSATIHDLSYMVGVSSAQATAIVRGLHDTSLLEHEVRLLEQHAVAYTVFGDAIYPTLLHNIHAPPPILYYKGNPAVFGNPTLAFIGSRRANYYAKRIVPPLIRSVVEAGFAVVSGGARGADSIAHQETLAAGGATVVVLGSGILSLYPPENEYLFSRVIEHGGLLASPFPMQAAPLPGNFPARNRIIAGLARGCIVVQAALKSGTHSTAQHALEQGKDVFAIPGPIDDPLSHGCHQLIQQGAKLVHCAADILIELQSATSYGTIASLPTPQRFTSKQQDTAPIQETDCSLPEVIILQSCTKPQWIEDLMRMSNLDYQELSKQLLTLQIAQKIQQDASGRWITTK